MVTVAGAGSVTRGGTFQCVTVPLSSLLFSYCCSWAASLSLRETTNPRRTTSARSSRRVECHCLLWGLKADKTARIWDVATAKPLCEPMGHKSDVTAVAFSPDSRHFLTGTWDGEVQLWETATRTPVGASLKHGGGITAVAFSPDGSRFLTASRGSTCLIRDLATRKLIAPPLQHDQPILAAVFSADGRIVLTGSEDRTARLWETESGRPLGSPLRHGDAVRDVGFSSDGETILTVNDSIDTSHQIARFWKVPRPVEGNPERLAVWVQVITGLELDADGMIHCLDAEKWSRLTERLVELGGPPR
jgi:WD40 repeat protein